MTIKINGDNTVANPGFSGADADTGLQVGTDELKLVTGGTTRATVDSSGRVLVGTGTAGHVDGDDLTIESSTSGGITVRTGTSSNGNLYFADGTTGDDRYRGYVQYQHATNTLRFATNAAVNVSINSDGYLLKANHPAFDVATNTNQNGDIVFNKAYVNQGSHYSTSTGRFTAPVAGLYIFHFTTIKQSPTSSTTRLYLRKNGTTIYDSRHLRLDGEVNTYAENGVTSFIVDLAVNDYVNVYGEYNTHASYNYSYFNGFLIG